MKTWEKPLATVEKFVANEYVAACWSVACDRPYVTDPEQISESGTVYDERKTFNKWTTHNKDKCGNSANYRIKMDENGTPTQLIEISPDYGELPCVLEGADVSTVKPGDYIYWTSSYGGNTWYHHGTVEANHS